MFDLRIKELKCIIDQLRTELVCQVERVEGSPRDILFIYRAVGIVVAYSDFGLLPLCLQHPLLAVLEQVEDGRHICAVALDENMIDVGVERFVGDMGSWSTWVGKMAKNSTSMMHVPEHFVSAVKHRVDVATRWPRWLFTPHQADEEDAAIKLDRPSFNIRTHHIEAGFFTFPYTHSTFSHCNVASGSALLLVDIIGRGPLRQIRG